MKIEGKVKLRYVGNVQELRNLIWVLNSQFGEGSKKYYEVFPSGSDGMFRAIVLAKDFVEMVG